MIFESVLTANIKSTLKEKMALQYRQLSVLVAAGIPLVQAIETLIEECHSLKVRNILSDLKRDIQNSGTPLEMPSKKKAFYNPGLLYLLSVSTQPEETASLLNVIADELEDSAALSKRVATSMIYPLATLIMALSCCCILLVFVLPVFQELFEGFGSDLPAPTQFVIDLSQFINQNLMYLFGAVFLIVILGVKFKGSIILIVSRVPFFNGLIQNKAVLQFSRYFSTMTAFEVPVKKALYYSGVAVDNPYFSNKLIQMSDAMAVQNDLKTVLAETRLFSKIFLQAVSVGEKSKNLHKVFEHITNFQEKRIKRALVRYTAIFDVFFIVLIGIIVGGLVISMYLPIFTMAGAI